MSYATAFCWIMYCIVIYCEKKYCKLCDCSQKKYLQFLIIVYIQKTCANFKKAKLKDS